MRIHKRFQVMFSRVHHPIVHTDEFHYFAWKHTCLFWLKHISLFLSTEQEKSNNLLYILEAVPKANCGWASEW